MNKLPIIPGATRIIDDSGQMTQEFRNHMNNVTSYLSNSIPQDGVLVPIVDNATSLQIEGDSSKNVQPRIIYNSDKKSYFVMDIDTNKFKELETK